MEREHGDLDGKRQGKGQKEDKFHGEGELCPVEFEQVEGVLARLSVKLEVKIKNGNKHEQAAEEGIEEELDRGVDSARPSPDTDDEVHGDEHGFPENVEKEQVQGNKGAQHSGLEQQQADVVGLHALLDGAPGAENNQGVPERW